MFEMLTSFIENVPMAVIATVIAAVIRSFFGWFENAYKDGVVTDFEFKQLIGTMGKYFAYIMLLMIGIPAASDVVGVTVQLNEAAGLATTIAFIIDVITSSLKNKVSPT